jgi:murein DD-endopeptidase
VLDADAKNNLASQARSDHRVADRSGQHTAADEDRLNIKQTLVLERTDDTYSANMLNEEVEWQKKV